ncbi:MAG: NADH-quinone oxidoreductase subunit C [Bacteroidota bacterium]|nr:NADH-quinone oxidoreductase subunit C [Bacteroidota bacterium]
MTPLLNGLVEALRAAFADRVLGVEEFRGDVTVLAEASAVADIAGFLRDNPLCPFDLCEDVFAIDQYRTPRRFEVKYHFFAVRNRVRIHIKTAVDEGDPRVPSIAAVYPAALFGEREAFDMMGIVFTGHPDLRRIYMPEDFAYHPLRKDFPLMGIPGSLTLPER